MKKIDKLAKLAKLNLTPQEVKKFPEQLSEILSYMEILKEVKTDKVEATSQVTSLENVFREDQSDVSLSQSQALSGGKKTQRNLFQIKRILNNH